MQTFIPWFLVGSWILAAYNIEWATYAWAAMTALLILGGIVGLIAAWAEEVIDLGASRWWNSTS